MDYTYNPWIMSGVLLWCYLKTTTLKSSEFFYLYGMRKDTNCQSELKPVFIYTGIHMFTSCSIVQYSSFNSENFTFLYIMKLYNMIHWPSQQ